MSEIDFNASDHQPVDDLCDRLRQVLSLGNTGPLGAAPEPSALPPECLRMLEDLVAIQRFVKGLSEGDLTSELYVRGRLASSLKALQANLRHLTWQVQQVAAGDLTQKVDFMGDFSAAFNLMIDRLDASQRMEREMRASADAFRDAAGDLNRALSQDEVLDSVITFGPRLTQVDALDVLLFSGEELHICRATGRQRDTEDELAEIEKAPLNLQSLPLMALAVETRRPEVASSAGGAVLPGYPASDWAQSVLVIALTIDSRVAGYFCALSAAQDCFTNDDAQRMSVYASQTAIAMSKARLVDALAWYASTDPLTGVPNRRNFFQRAEQELDRARRTSRVFSVLLLDIDHFKTINDTFGHAVGDQALSQVASLCIENLRVIDTIGRLGGEEFGVLLPETDESCALKVAERLRQAIANRELQIEGEAVQITASIGVAVWGGGEESFQVTLNHADRAMYLAKQHGRDRTATYSLGVAE